jgi:hypothetical protein
LAGEIEENTSMSLEKTDVRNKGNRGKNERKIAK